MVNVGGVSSKLRALGFSVDDVGDNRYIATNNATGKKVIVEDLSHAITMSGEYKQIKSLGCRDKYLVKDNEKWFILHRGDKKLEGKRFDWMGGVHTTSKGIVHIAASYENIFSSIVDEDDNDIIPLTFGRVSVYKTGTGHLYTIKSNDVMNLFLENGERHKVSISLSKYPNDTLLICKNSLIRYDYRETDIYYVYDLKSGEDRVLEVAGLTINKDKASIKFIDNGLEKVFKDELASLIV